MIYRVTYFTNLNLRDKFFGYTPGDVVTEVGTHYTSADDSSYACEAGFRYFNRINGGTPGEVVLDKAEAPSMSVGDVVRVIADGACAIEKWFAVSSIGWEKIDAPTVMARRFGVTVKDAIRKTEVAHTA